MNIKIFSNGCINFSFSKHNCFNSVELLKKDFLSENFYLKLKILNKNDIVYKYRNKYLK